MWKPNRITCKRTHGKPKRSLRGKKPPNPGDPLINLTTIKLSRMRSTRTFGRTCVYKVCFVRFIQSSYLAPHSQPTMKWLTTITEDVSSGLTGWGEGVLETWGCCGFEAVLWFWFWLLWFRSWTLAVLWFWGWKLGILWCWPYPLNAFLTGSRFYQEIKQSWWKK